MERRSEPRMALAAGSPLAEVTLEILGETALGPCAGNILDVSAEGVRVACGQAIRPGSAVKVLLENEMWLAEATYCLQLASYCVVGMKVKQRLGGLQELRRLMDGLFGVPVADARAGSDLPVAV